MGQFFTFVFLGGSSVSLATAFQMSDRYEFPNDPEDAKAANKEETETLSARSSWIGVANSTQHGLKVKTYFKHAETQGEGSIENWKCD